MTANVDPLDWDELPDLMTVDEVRRFLRIGDRQARRWAKERDLYLKVGGSARIPKAGLAEVLNEEAGKDIFEIIDSSKNGVEEK